MGLSRKKKKKGKEWRKGGRKTLQSCCELQDFLLCYSCVFFLLSSTEHVKIFFFGDSVVKEPQVKSRKIVHFAILVYVFATFFVRFLQAHLLQCQCCRPLLQSTFGRVNSVTLQRSCSTHAFETLSHAFSLQDPKRKKLKSTHTIAPAHGTGANARQIVQMPGKSRRLKKAVGGGETTARFAS